MDKAGRNFVAASPSVDCPTFSAAVAPTTMRHPILRAVCTVLLAAFTLPLALTAQRPRPVPSSYSRDSLTGRLADLVRIHTPEGIEQLEQLDVNGSKQWIHIRGLNRANPVILVLHGGPGSPVMGMAWAYQKPWEDFFTVVNWDQRGAGKSFSAADSSRLASTMTEEQLAEDCVTVIRHLQKVLGIQKVVLLGFSHGTVFGPLVAQAHPELVSAYVGVGQTSTSNEAVLYQTMLRRATARKDTAMLGKLARMAPYPPADGSRPPVRDMLAMRALTQQYDGGWYGKKNLDLYYKMWEWAPMYSAEEAAAVGPASGWTNRQIVEGVGAKRPPPVTAFAVPVFVLQGRYDLMTNYEGAKAWFDRLSAPTKKFITFERSAHFVMFEEPGRFLMTLVNEVLPIAGGSPGFKPGT